MTFLQEDPTVTPHLTRPWRQQSSALRRAGILAAATTVALSLLVACSSTTTATADSSTAASSDSSTDSAEPASSEPATSDSAPAGDSSGESSSSASDETPAQDLPVPEKSDITVGVLAITNSAPFAYALENGIFTKYGLNVTQAVASGGAAAAAALAGGSQDISYGSYVPFVLADQSGVPLTFVASEDVTAPGNTMVVTGADSGVTKPEDLKGKTIAVNALVNYGVLGIETTLERYGLTPDDYKLVAMPHSNIPPAVTRGAVDAGWVLEPLVSQAHAAGARDVFDPFTGEMDNFPSTGFLSTRAFAEKNPGTVRAFRAAIDESIREINKDPDAIRDLIATYTETSTEVAQAMVLPKYVESDALFADLQRVPDFMLKAKFMEQPFDINSWALPE